MAGWNYRAIQHEHDDGRAYYEVHEVYCDDEGKPESWTKDGIKPYTDTLDGLRLVLEKMAAGAANPALRIVTDETGEKDLVEILPVPEPAYIEKITMQTEQTYNPKYGDDRMCVCGHPYHRHFDSYDDMAAVGCKYCECYVFREAKIPPETPLTEPPEAP